MREPAQTHINCHRQGKIVAKQVDYILAVEDNQGSLLDGIKDSFRMLAADAVAEEIDCGHGRVERRRCLVVADLSLVEKAAEWASLQGLVRIQSERHHKATARLSAKRASTSLASSPMWRV